MSNKKRIYRGRWTNVFTYALAVVESSFKGDIIDLGDEDLLGVDAGVPGEAVAQVVHVRVHGQGQAYPDLPRRLVKVDYGDYHRSHLKVCQSQVTRFPEIVTNQSF